MRGGDPREYTALTTGEIGATSLVVLLAVAIVAAYLPYRFGLRVQPIAVLLVAVLCAGAVIIRSRRRWSADAGELTAAAAILIGIFAGLLRVARPNLLPIGGGSDLTPHMVLIDYIASHWQLVYDPGLVPYLGDMIYYTPGMHLLMALVSSWTRTDTLHVVHPVLAFTAALKCAVVFLIARRVLPTDTPRTPLGVTAVLLLFLPLDYFLGSFIHDSYWSQVLAELFACGAWWALVVWDQYPTRARIGLAGLLGAATFLAWPIWVGPLAIAAVMLVLVREDLSLKSRVDHLITGLAPIAAAATIHMIGRLEWLRMAATSGAVIPPSAASFTMPFAIVSAIGVVVMMMRRQGRATALIACAIAVQAAVLFVLARRRGAETPYMAYKMMYLLIYPLAVGSSVAIAEAWRMVERSTNARGGRSEAAAWALVVVLAAVIAPHLGATPAPPRVVSESVQAAGVWARSNVNPACVDYLVADGYTGYWLHLAVLRNPRPTARMADPDTFEPDKAIVRWLYPDGLPYAIVDDLTKLPRDVRDGFDVLARFGPAAVVRRRGPALCSDQR